MCEKKSSNSVAGLYKFTFYMCPINKNPPQTTCPSVKQLALQLNNVPFS